MKHDILCAIRELCAALLLFGEVLFFWTVGAALANGTAIPPWCAWFLRAAVIGAAAAAVIFLCGRIRRALPARNARRGVIGAEEICRIMAARR